MHALTRRASLFLPFLLAACGDDDDTPPPRAVRRDFPPPRYGYLPPIPLNVQRLEISSAFEPSTDKAEVSGQAPISPAETLFAVARDRLKPMGPSGLASFSVRTASFTLARDKLTGTLVVRLDVRNDDGTNTGYAEARVTASHTGNNDDLRAAIYDMLKTLMDDMNVELEFQVRGKLRAWIYEPPPPVPEPVDPSMKLPLPPAPPAPSAM